MSLKGGKGDGNTASTMAHFNHACPELSVYISFLFTGLPTHGIVPADLVTIVLSYLFLKEKVLSQIQIIIEVMH